MATHLKSLTQIASPPVAGPRLAIYIEGPFFACPLLEATLGRWLRDHKFIL